MVAILNQRLIMLGRYWPIGCWRLIYNRCIDTQSIWWFLGVHFHIRIILLLNVRTCRGGAISLNMLDYWLLLFIRLLLLIWKYSRLIRIKTLVLNLRRLLSWFVSTNAVLGVKLSIYTFCSISAWSIRYDLGLFSQHMYLLVFLLPLPALRPVIGIRRSVILCDINLIIALLRDDFRWCRFVHRFHSGTTIYLCVWLLLAICFFIHGLHQSVVSIYCSLDIWWMNSLLTLPCLLLNNCWLFETRMLIYETVAVFFVVSWIPCINSCVNSWSNSSRLCQNIIVGVSCLLPGHRLLLFIYLIFIKFVFKLKLHYLKEIT